MKSAGPFCLFFLLCSPPLIYAQTPTMGVNATTFLYEESETNQLQEQVLDLLRQELRQRGIPSKGAQQTTLLVDAVDIGAGAYRSIVLSITKLMSLPEPVLEVGAREELFYVSVPDTMDLPREGTAMRQYMSREWLSQYQRVVDQQLRVVPADQVEEAVTALVDALMELQH